MATGSHVKVKNAGSNAQCVTLLGDRRYPEHDTFIVYFPGGRVIITRCTDDSLYWVHTVINRDDEVDERECQSNEIALGKIVDATFSHQGTGRPDMLLDPKTYCVSIQVQHAK